MAYIGKTPIIGNFVKLDAISVVNGQASYTMQNGGSNFTEYETVNQFLVSLNGILQSPTDSFTVASSTITFASNLATGDVIDFIIVLGNTLDVGTVSDNTVSLAKLTATGTKDATTFLRGDNTFAEVPAGGITEADQWRLTADVTSDGDITSNLERPDHSGFGYIGTGMTESSGIFSFPSTGIYSVRVNMSADASGTDTIRIYTYQTNDNSSYSIVASATTAGDSGDAGSSSEVFVDVTNTTNVKIKFAGSSIGAGSDINGASNYNRTSFTFIRLGDT